MLCQSRAVCMGYLNDKEKTLEAIDDDGWLHSGDLVRPDDEGFYKVVGRIKEIIIPSGGENVTPTNIEEEIKNNLSEAISNVMVCGDGKRYLTCILTLKVLHILNQIKGIKKSLTLNIFFNPSQPVRASAITFEFGKHIKGHESLNL